SKIKLQNLILHNTHCNGYGQIFKENLSQNQRFGVETQMFRLTITIISADIADTAIDITLNILLTDVILILTPRLIEICAKTNESTATIKIKTSTPYKKFSCCTVWYSGIITRANSVNKIPKINVTV
ncbi:MAG: hypothetical protein IJN65_05200, partial [Clostridia bacterium]|nr:hypothetical protein [Clostridia bacterium]